MKNNGKKKRDTKRNVTVLVLGYVGYVCCFGYVG